MICPSQISARVIFPIIFPIKVEGLVVHLNGEKWEVYIKLTQSIDHGDKLGGLMLFKNKCNWDILSNFC